MSSVNYYCSFTNKPKSLKVSKTWLVSTNCGAICSAQSLKMFRLARKNKWNKLKNLLSSHQKCSVKKGVPGNFTKFTGKYLCQSLFFNKVAGLRPALLLKKRLWHCCFPLNFVKFLRTFFLQRLWHYNIAKICYCDKKKLRNVFVLASLFPCLIEKLLLRNWLLLLIILKTEDLLQAKCYICNSFIYFVYNSLSQAIRILCTISFLSSP